mgnify:CR=1 FL=1
MVSFGSAGLVGVSIHAPARGATTPQHPISILWIAVSIHAPARGATMRWRRVWLLACVSIHAPARGATPVSTIHGWHLGQFQSTHPRGVRPPPAIPRKAPNKTFQSTHPRGVRPQISANMNPDHGFNPRTREGCDVLVGSWLKDAVRFQSTHPRGVRPRRTS